MLPTKLKLEVVTPDKLVLSETVDEVILPGQEGYLGVLPGHAPLLAALTIGKVVYRQGNEKSWIALAWGFAEILPEKVTILADVAEDASDIDLERAKAKKAEIEQAIRSAGAEFDFAQARASLAKAIIRIEVASEGARHRAADAERRAHRDTQLKTDIGE